jgi:hypothetical protein
MKFDLIGTFTINNEQINIYIMFIYVWEIIN